MASAVQYILCIRASSGCNTGSSPLPLCCFWMSQQQDDVADADGLGSRRILRLATAFAAQAALFDLPGPSAFCGKARDAASVRPMRKDIHERVRRHVVFPKTRRFASVASSARPRGASRTSDTDSAYNYFSASLRLSHGLRQILLDTILMASCPPFVSCSSSCINTTSFLRIAPLNGAAQFGCNTGSSRYSNAANLTRQFACKARLPIDTQFKFDDTRRRRTRIVINVLVTPTE